MDLNTASKDDMRSVRWARLRLIETAFNESDAFESLTIYNWYREVGPKRKRLTSDKKKQMLRAYMVAKCQHDAPLRAANYLSMRRETLKRWLAEVHATRKRWKDFDNAVVHVSKIMAEKCQYAKVLPPAYEAAPSVTYIVTSYKYQHDSTYDAAVQRRDTLQAEHPDKQYRIMKVLNVTGDGIEAARSLKKGV